ncbi:MAG: hypothetical protein H3C58_09125 [Fimbriimonadaceae bacterium]|nr:hypothetical protein [Fimbriimonadaceae bacterium]
MAARNQVKLTPKAPPSAELMRLTAKGEQLAREAAGVGHLRTIEEAQRVGLARRRLGTLTKAIFVVGVAEDGGPTINGERVRLDAGHRDKVGRRRGARKVRGSSGYSQAIFDLADTGEAWLTSRSQIAKLDVILKRWNLCVDWRDPTKKNVVVLRWHDGAPSDLTPVFRRDRAEALTADQLQVVMKATDSVRRLSARPPLGHKNAKRGHKRTKSRTSSTQPPARTRRRGARP